MAETAESMQAYENDQNRTSPPQQRYEETPWWMRWLLCAPKYIRVSGHPFGGPPDGSRDVPSLGRPDTTSRRWM
jgi:hypothetical protein